MEMYEVDLRNRKTGDSVECIYSGDSHTKACEIADNWNKEHLVDYNEDLGFDDYVDHKTDGLSACVYVVENEAYLHGVGKFSEEDIMTEFETKILFGLLLMIKHKRIKLDEKLVEKLAEHFLIGGFKR